MMAIPVALDTARDGPVPLDLADWDAPATEEELGLLDQAAAPVLDIGCGPGRLLVSLAERGLAALGVDVSSSAVALARQKGACVLRRDVFDRLPGEGMWATALLFDGTVGIGGNPVRLLGRCAGLLAPSGQLIAETGPPGTGWRELTAWVEHDGRQRGDTFRWATVGMDAVLDAADDTGFTVTRLEHPASGRWFAVLAAPGP